MHTLVSKQTGRYFPLAVIIITIAFLSLFLPKIRASLAAQLAGPRLSIPSHIPAETTDTLGFSPRDFQTFLDLTNATNTDAYPDQNPNRITYTWDADSYADTPGML